MGWIDAEPNGERCLDSDDDVSSLCLRRVDHTMAKGLYNSKMSCQCVAQSKRTLELRL